MAVKIRLKRLGKIRVPQYRIVVVDSRKKRDGKVLEEIGKYHPKEDPSYIDVVSDRAQYWLGVGAQPSEAVEAILKVTGDWQKFKGLPGAEGTLKVKEEKRSPSGVEIQLSGFEILHLTQDFPITPKEHGTAFLMEHRHLWLRSSRQRSALRVRSEVEQAIRDFFYERDFTLIDSPILTPAACEGTSNLFETDYFGDKAYLSQSGQLYLEPAAAALGFCTFGQAAAWASDEAIIEALHRHHPRSPSAQQMMGELMFKRYGQPARAAEHYQRAATLAPWEAGYAIRAVWARRAAGELGPTEVDVQAIAQALRERPVPPTTLIALQNLADCARTDDAACRDMLSALLYWLDAAQANPRLAAMPRQQVRMSYGQVCLETERYAQGLAWVQSAYRHSGLPVYRLMEANFLMLQNDLDGAAALLADVARLPQLTGEDREHIAVLEDAIPTRRAAAADGPG